MEDDDKDDDDDGKEKNRVDCSSSSVCGYKLSFYRVYVTGRDKKSNCTAG